MGDTDDHGPTFLRVGGTDWMEAPPGRHIARCTKVDPDFKFKDNRKLVIYFTIRGPVSGLRARLFYPKRPATLAQETGSDFGIRSKLFKDLARLFPQLVGTGIDMVEIDPVMLFLGQDFEIEVEQRQGKKAEVPSAIVVRIEHCQFP